MKGDIINSQSSYLERENARIMKMREASLKRCGVLTLSCSQIDNKWGIWMEIGGERMLVNPIELVSSVFEDNTYYMLQSQNKNMPGFFSVQVEKKSYCYLWTLSHSMLSISSENRFVQEEYVSTIHNAVSQLYEAIQAGGELTYERDVYKESIVSCHKQLLKKGTWPSYIRKTTKDIQIEEFLFNVNPGNEGEGFSIGIGDRSYPTWFSHWDGNLERIRHQLESYTFERKAEVKITFDMSETILKLEDISIINEINETNESVSFKYKEYVLATIIPNEFVNQPIFKGYCDREQVLRTLYNGLLRMALDHPIAGNNDVPDMLNAYNMIKSPLIEDHITGRYRSHNDKLYAIRQTIVRHIITIDPDIAQLFYDEEDVSYEVEPDGTVDFIYDKKGNPIVMKDFFTWHNEINQIVINSETGHPCSIDWEQYHHSGVELAQNLRKVLSPDFDLWYKAPFEDKSGIIKHQFLVLER